MLNDIQMNMKIPSNTFKLKLSKKAILNKDKNITTNKLASKWLSMYFLSLRFERNNIGIYPARSANGVMIGRKTAL